MLTVKALRCVNLRNVAEGTAERQDPYVTLTLQENPKLHSKTDVCYSGGQNPQWWSGNWMRLPVPQPNMTCLIQVWDKHAEDADELIASGSLKLGRYDDDGTEEEPLAIDLFWQNGLAAGQFQCILTYDPPTAHIPAGQLEATSLEDSRTGSSREAWLPWLKLYVRHRSGKVKELFISRTSRSVQGVQTRGRGFLETNVPRARVYAQQQYTQFRSRPTVAQIGLASLFVLLVALPWPRMLASYVFTGLYNLASMSAANINLLLTNTFGVVFGGLSWAMSWTFGVAWRLLSVGLILGGLFGGFIVAPVLGVLCMPRFLGWSLTRLASMVTGGHLIAFGTITVVPWITDLKRLKFRVIVVDFLLGNPRDKGFTPRLMSFNRFEMVGSFAFADLRNVFTLTPVATPLKDVPDYKRLISLRIDHLEIDGVAVNLEVNDKNRLNLLDLLSDFERGQVERALAKKDINPKTFRFPNCLEVQVLGARNLRSADSNSLSDPFYTVRVRKQELVSTTVVKTLNPAFPPRVEQFFVNDPAAMLSVELKDEDIGRPADYLGQWVTPVKNLLIDPRKCKLSEWERLTEDERRQGWVGFWAPLVDEHFHCEGELGEVHLRMRWVYNPALPDVRPGERRESQTPLQQLNVLRHEIRQRLGDLDRIIDILKHIPILLDFQGVFAINDTKISVRDLLYGRPTDRDNVVKQILVRQREEAEKQQSQQVQTLPRSLKMRETAAAVDQERLGPMLAQEQEQVMQQSIDRVDEVIVQSADPSVPLPRGLDIEVTTTPGIASMGVVPGALGATKVVPERVHRLDESAIRQQSPAPTQDARVVQDRPLGPMSIEQQQQMASTGRPIVTDTNTMITDRIASEIGKGDQLNAVYPDKLVTSVPMGEKGYVRGELAEISKDVGISDRVYLGAEDDDDAAEERNEDRFDDDEREYDQDGREYIKVRPIIWRRQFLTRHGDPGINVYKFLERLVRSIVPKLASDSRLQKALAGSTLKGIFKGGLTSGARSSGGASTDMGTATAGAHRGGVVGAIKGVAHAVKNQAKLVEKKVLHHKQDADLRTDPSDPTSSQELREREGEVVPGQAGDMSPSAVSTTRPVHGQDENFYKRDLLIAGSLEAVWQGRHRITSLFRRWKLWHVEVKGDQVFYHKMHSMSANSASDAVWYTLDLTWLSDMNVTESSRVSNNELVLRFVQDDNTLHLRLPNKVAGPTLAEWLAAFRKVQKSQQDRRRLGSMADNETAWPGEDIQPAQRPRGSSLAAPSVTVIAPKPVQYQVESPTFEEKSDDFSTAVEQPHAVPRRAPPAVPPLNPEYQPIYQEPQQQVKAPQDVLPSFTVQQPQQQTFLSENKPMMKEVTTTTTNIEVEQGAGLEHPRSVVQS